ncbi:hypothetical protein BH10ACT9_BH10ACT9_18080 [soil metagenome]
MTRSNKRSSGSVSDDREPLATTADVAAYLNTSTDGLAQMRYRREGPPHVKLGAKVLYRWADVHAWVAAHVQGV